MTLFITHPACHEHRTPPDHPERPDRLNAIEQVLEHEKFTFLGTRAMPKSRVRNRCPMPSVGIHRSDSQGGAPDRAGTARR